MQRITKRIIREQSYDLRARGRWVLKGRWWTAALVVFLYTVFVAVPPIILDNVFGITVDLSQVDLYKDYVNSMNELLEQNGITDVSWIIKSSPLSSVYVLLVAGPFNYGILKIFLEEFRTGEFNLDLLFSGFENFFRTMGLLLFMLLFVLLWSIIPFAGVVLGVIAIIRYSQAFFLMLDHPDWSITECVNASKYLMEGNKGKFFVMNLTFIGWLILSSMLASIFDSIAMYATDNWAMQMLINLVGQGGFYFAQAYIYSTQAAFYEILVGNLPGNVFIPSQPGGPGYFNGQNPYGN